MKKVRSRLMSRELYSYRAYHEQQLQKFISFGELAEGEVETHTLIESQSTKINDGPKEEPLGIRAKLPTFKGWPEEMQ